MNEHKKAKKKLNYLECNEYAIESYIVNKLYDVLYQI